MYGIFSTKQKMQLAIEEHIKDSFKRTGRHGNYNFRYIEMNVDEPWFSPSALYRADIGKALFSFSTMHTEYFTHKVETNWNTGKITVL